MHQSPILISSLVFHYNNSFKVYNFFISMVKIEDGFTEEEEYQRRYKLIEKSAQSYFGHSDVQIPVDHYRGQLPIKVYLNDVSVGEIDCRARLISVFAPTHYEDFMELAKYCERVFEDEFTLRTMYNKNEYNPQKSEAPSI